MEIQLFPKLIFSVGTFAQSQCGERQCCIAKIGGGYTQTGVAKGLKVPCLFMIAEVSIRCQKNPGGWYTPYTRVYPPVHLWWAVTLLWALESLRVTVVSSEQWTLQKFHEVFEDMRFVNLYLSQVKWYVFFGWLHTMSVLM